MHPVRDALDSAVRALVGPQPLTDGKVQFAWRLAAGPAIARATSVALEGGILRVRVEDPHWRREVRRLSPALLERLRAVLGETAVKRLTIAANPKAPGNA